MLLSHVSRVSQDQGFHYDKDEAATTSRGRLEFASASTITYLSDGGGPTLILNQTTSPASPRSPQQMTAIGPE